MSIVKYLHKDQIRILNDPFPDLFKDKPHFMHILDKMFKMVGAPHYIISDDGRWFTRYHWTENKQNKFKDWMFMYLSSHRPARVEFGMNYKRNDLMKSTVEGFIFQYGWSIKESKNGSNSRRESVRRRRNTNTADADRD